MAVAYRPMNIPSPPKTPPPILLKDFLGVDFSTDSTVIDNRRSPNMLNMIPDDSGILNKRTGYSKVYSDILGGDAWSDAAWATAYWGLHSGATDRPIQGMFEYRKSTGDYERLVACSSHLFTWDDSGAQPVEKYGSLADAPTKAFEMNGKLYIQDGTNYLQYDGTNVTVPTPYIPTLFTGMVPASGSGTLYQSFNLLGAGFKNSFSGTVGDTVYKLSLQSLDATAITTTVNGVAMVETTNFTVNRTTGVVTFLVAPGLGTDNVVITAYKTISGYSDRIKKCTINIVFEGRVIVSGNPDYFNSDWYSELYDPTYFPLSNNSKVGNDSEKITGYINQYSYLVILKEKSTHKRVYDPNSTLSSIYIDTRINPEIGCIAPKSIAMINNNPVVLSHKGVYMLQAGDTEDERNYIHLSHRIDPRLLIEADIENASGIDFDNKYHLTVNGNVYVFDYQNMSEPDEQNKYSNLGEWYFWTIENSCCFYSFDSRIYIGSKNKGMIYKFRLESEPSAYVDDGVAIECYWYGKQFSMDSHSYKKNVDKIFVTLQPDNKTSCDLYYISDGIISSLIETISQYLFSYSAFGYTTFNYITNRFPTSKRSKVKAKKIVYFQPILKNNKLNESMGIQALEIHFTYVSEVK